MKKLLFVALCLATALTACSKHENDDEKNNDGPFTFQVTVPEDTDAKDVVYLVGPCTGGDEMTIGNPKWALKGDAVRTIEVDPTNFIGGMTLDDGFWFESDRRGRELDADGKTVFRTLKPKAGKTYEFTVEDWTQEAKTFDPSGAWTIVGSFTDTWDVTAGIPMTAEGNARIAKAITLAASDEFKFVMDASWETNFGGGAAGFVFAVTPGEEFDLMPDGGNIKAPAGTYDIYLYPFDAKAKLVEAGEEPPTPQDKPVTGVSVSPTELALMVGASQALTATVTPTDADVKSIAWTSSDTSVATVSQEGLVTAVAEGTATVTVTVDGFTASCSVTVSLETPPEPGVGPTVYVFNATGWIYVWLYGWVDEIGDVETAWCGRMPDDVAQVGEFSYYKYVLSDNWSSGTVNLIFNDGTSAQTPSYPISMQASTDYFFYVSDTKVEIIPDPYNFDPSTFEDPGPNPGNAATLYVYDGNAWGSMRLWVWNTTGNLYDSWPGAQSEGTETVSGHSFYKFTLPEAWCGNGVNLLFNDGNGNQTSDLVFDIAAGSSVYFCVSGTSATIIDDPASFNPGEPPAQDDSWGIAGTMNGWNATAPIEMEVEGAYYVAHAVTLAADTEFKFVQNKSWTVNRGGTFVAVNQEFAVYQDGSNIMPGLTGTYDIYIKADGSTALIVQ